MIIIGAGMAGLTAANLMARHKPTIIEAQPSLPNNHSAVLRFKTAHVGDALNIPFRKVGMIKATVPWRNPVADALAYSFKNSGAYRSDRSINDGTVMADRYIAPSDLIARMAADCDIHFGRSFVTGVDQGPIISTMPMPSLMRILKYPHEPKFTSVPGLNIRATIENCDAYVSLMVPDPSFPFSRISITGNELIIECPNPAIDGAEKAPNAYSVLEQALELLGLDDAIVSAPTTHQQHYAKINPIDEDLRKRFIIWATDRHQVYSLGRFSTWRTRMMLDHLPQDIQVISRLIQTGHSYDQRK